MGSSNDDDNNSGIIKSTKSRNLDDESKKPPALVVLILVSMLLRPGLSSIINQQSRNHKIGYQPINHGKKKEEEEKNSLSPPQNYIVKNKNGEEITIIIKPRVCTHKDEILEPRRRRIRFGALCDKNL